MTFKEVDFDNFKLLETNFSNMAYNLLKIQYFYEENQFLKLSRSIEDKDALQHIVESYLRAADEAYFFLKVVSSFISKKINIFDHKEYLDELINYFHVKDYHLQNFELDSEENFYKWIQEKI